MRSLRCVVFFFCACSLSLCFFPGGASELFQAAWSCSGSRATQRSSASDGINRRSSRGDCSGVRVRLQRRGDRDHHLHHLVHYNGNAEGRGAPGAGTFAASFEFAKSFVEFRRLSSGCIDAKCSYCVTVGLFQKSLPRFTNVYFFPLVSIRKCSQKFSSAGKRPAVRCRG